MTLTETTKLLTVLQVMWPHRDITEQVARVYQAALADIPLEDALEAAKRWMMAERYFPTAADLRALCEPLSARRLYRALSAESIARHRDAPALEQETP